MATAVEPSSPSRTPNPQAKLVLASLVGAAYVLAALAVVGYAVPFLWREHVAPHLGDKLLSGALWVAVEIAVAAGLVWFGRSLAGSNPPKGLRGGIFLFDFTEWPPGRALPETDPPEGAGTFDDSAAVILRRVAVLNAAYDLLTSQEDATASWCKLAGADQRCSDAAIKHQIKLRFGEKIIDRV